MESQSELIGNYNMLPPEPGTFENREELIKYVRDFGASQGYVVTIKKSRRDIRVMLGCDRGGVYRNRRKIEESQRKRKACSRLINCPFEAVGKREDDMWVLTIKNGDHNHEPLKDMSEHPYSRRFSEEEVRQIKQLTEAGVKPRQVLKTLKQSNPELQSTPRHLYNLKAKIRQGNLSEKSFKSWRPNRSALVNTSTSPSGGLSVQNNEPLKVPNFIGGKFVESQGSTIFDVTNPATQEVVSRVSLTTYEEFKDAVIAAKKAFPLWKNTPIATRERIMFKLQGLIHRDMDKLSMNITLEQGKTFKSAQGDVLRGLEVVEHACGMASLQTGEFVPNASNGIDTYCIREPLGVCAGICPFNFPAMTALWMFPIAVVCGNTFILKPCEKNPGASMMLAALAVEAGLPDGVLNIVHGSSDVVNYICDDDDIKALSFLGSDTTGMHIYARAAARGKRVQSNIGGKNHAIVMPDATMADTLNTIVAAGFGAAGQRCMALNTVVFVGGSMAWESELVERAKALKVNVGTDPSADIGPVTSKEVKDRVCRLVQSGIDSGAKLLLDGRNISVPGYENGSFIGPTILCNVTTTMDCYKEEIFGPVLLCMQADSLEEAITIVNRNRYGNGVSIFTTSGVAARKFQNDIEAALVGINFSVPVPLSFSSFSEPKTSFARNLNICGKSGVQFYTQIKTVAQKWMDLPSFSISSMLPSSEMETSRGVSSAFRQVGRDSPGRKLSSIMLHEIERDPSRHGASSEDPSNSGVSSGPSIADEDIPSQGGSLVLPSTANQDFHNQGTSLSTRQAKERELSSQEMSISMAHSSKRVYLSQASQWNETAALSSRTESASTNSQRMYLSTSEMNDSSSSKRADAAFTLAASGCSLYIPTADENHIGLVSQRNDGVAQISGRTGATVHEASDRLYDMIATSHLNDSIDQTFQRTDTMFSTSERRFLPTSHGIDLMDSASQRTETAAHPASERMYISTTSHRTDDMPTTSETTYMPAIVQRNDGATTPSERLYMPMTSQRMYTENSMISLDDFPSQGASMSLPTSQRI